MLYNKEHVEHNEDTHLDDVMVSVVDGLFDPQSSDMKYYEIGMCCLSTLSTNH